jgi:hypothetical protein
MTSGDFLCWSNHVLGNLSPIHSQHLYWNYVHILPNVQLDSIFKATVVRNQTIYVVLATDLGCTAAVDNRTGPQAPVNVRNPRASQPGWTEPGWFLERTWTYKCSTGFEPGLGSNSTVCKPVVGILYCGSDRMVTWSVCKMSNCGRSFTSQWQSRNPTDNRWVAFNQVQSVCEISEFSVATLWILVGSQVWIREIKSG